MKTEISQKVGQNIKRIRKERGLTQKEIAAEFKFTQQRYSRFETGMFELNYAQILKLCKIFNVTPTELLTIEDE